MTRVDNDFAFPKAQIYTLDYVKKRIEWLSKNLGVDLHYISTSLDESERFKGFIENLVGGIQIPLGVAGPLEVHGEFAEGLFFVPFATAQSTLVRTYDRGMAVLAKCGGVRTLISKDEMHITPVFWLNSLYQAKEFVSWIKDSFVQIRKETEKATSHGELLRIQPTIIGRKVFLTFYYQTGDAMGLNMIVIATEKACRYILEKADIRKFYLRSNLSSDKKATFLNFVNGYGREVLAEALIPQEIITKYLNTTSQEMYDCWHSAVLGSMQAGMIGVNAHFANGLAAVFTACGQDLASIVNAHTGIGECEITGGGDLYTSLKIPCLPIGTLGGATSLPWQRECLEILGCFGAGKADKFAEIIGATLLAGEISLVAALAGGYFSQAHIDARKRKTE